MVKKLVSFDIYIKTSEQTPTHSYTAKQKVMSNDNDSAQIIFNLLDVSPSELSGVTASVMLYMQDGSFFQSSDVVIDRNTIIYTMKPEETKHSGSTKVQIVLKKGSIQTASIIYNFDIDRGLEKYPITEVMIQDWTTLTAEAKAFVEQIEGFTLAEFVENKMGEELANLEVNYAGRLTGLETKDTQLTAQLAQAAIATVGGISDINLNVTSINVPDNPLDIPCYFGDEAVHPSVVYFADRWNGYKYWMAFTPYEGTDNQYENPSIVASDDGLNWVVPAGLTNPIEPALGGGAYNSDPTLFLDKDKKTLNIVYRQYGAVGKPTDERLYLKSSTDGINWTPIQLVLASDSTYSRPVAPSIMWNGKEYVMFYVDIVPSPRKIMIRKSSDLFTWTTAQELVVFTDTLINPWHCDVTFYKGNYYMLCQGGGGGGGGLYLAKSSDGVFWTANNSPLFEGRSGTWTTSPYKGSILPLESSDGLKFSLWLSSAGTLGWKTGYCEISFSEGTINEVSKKLSDMDYTNKKIYATSKIPPYLMIDTFDRADTTTGLGVSDSGQPWVNDASNFVVKDGKASPALDATTTRSYVNVGYSNVKIELTVLNIASQLWIVGRFKNEDSFIRVGVQTGTVYIQTITSGASTTLASLGKVIRSGDTLDVRFNGTNISMWVNGEKVIETTSSFNLTETRIGLQALGIAAAVDDIIVSSLDPTDGAFFEKNDSG